MYERTNKNRQWPLAATLVACCAVCGCNRSADRAARPATNAVQNDDDNDLPPEIKKALEEVADAKSKALLNATTKINRAYYYHGATEIQSRKDFQLIAVDVSFAGYTYGFKIWDLDIVDK